MIKKNKVLNSIKTILGISLAIPTFFVSNKLFNNNYNVVSNNINLSNLKSGTQTIDSISSFADYNPMYSDANSPLISTNKGFLGRSNDNGILVFTSYDGVISWMVDVRTIPEIIDYYKSISITDISSFTIKSTINIGNYLAVLFSSIDKKNSIVFALEIDNGKLYAPAKESNGTISISQNIKKVNDDSTVLFQAPSPINSLYVFPEGKGKNLKNKVMQVSITNNNLGSIDLSNGILSENEEDDFVGFVPGHNGTFTNFGLFINNTTKNYYIKIFSSSLEIIKNPANQALVFDQNIKFEVVENGQIKNANDIPKHGIRSNASTGAYDDKFIFVLYGKNAIIRHYWFSTNNSRFQYRAKFTFENKNPYRFSKINNSNKLMYSVEKSSDNTIFGIVDMGAGHNATSEETIVDNKNVKSSSNANQTSKPWPLIAVQGSNNKAYLYMDPITNDNKVKYEWNDSTNGNDLHFTNPVDLVFKKYSFNTDFFKYKIPSTITDEELKSNLKISNNNNSGLDIVIENRMNDDYVGKITFNYKISYNNWWDNSSNEFKVYIENSNLYKFSDFNFKFVTSESVDAKKFEAINAFKKTSYPKAITKQNIKDSFISYNIKDRNGDVFTISDEMITLTPNDNQGTLKVDIDMTKGTNSNNLLPIGINNFSSYYKKSYTFENFMSLEGYTFSFKTLSSNILSKHPSEITFYDVITEFVELGNAYSKAESDWEFEKEANDVSGEYIIKKLNYINSKINSSLPEENKNIISSDKKYSNFKSSVSLLNETISMKEFDKTQILTRKPSDVWNEYKNALDSNNDLNVERSLLFQVLQQNIVVKKTDLLLEATNESTMDIDQKIDLSITIRKNAILIPKIGNNNIVFDETFETELKKQKPNYYPFAISQKVVTQNFDLDWNIIESNREGFELNQSKTELTIDLDNVNWDKLNNKTTAFEFANNLDSYKNQIKELFEYNENYEIVINEPTLNIANGIVWIRVDFIPVIRKESSNLYKHSLKSSSLSTISKQIVIKGFKIPSSILIQMIPLLSLIITSILVVVVLIWLFLKNFKRNNLKSKSFVVKEKDNTRKSYLVYDDSKTEEKLSDNKQKRYI